MKSKGVHLRKLERRYIEEQKEKEEMNQPQFSWLVNNILFCYEGEIHTGNDNERKHHFLNTKENIVITKKPTRMDQKTQADKATKQAIYMPEMTKTRLPHTICLSG